MEARSYKYEQLPFTIRELYEQAMHKPSFKKSKVTLAVCKDLVKPLRNTVIYSIIRSELLLNLYITNFIKRFVINCIEIQTNIISIALSFINRIRGNIKSQSFVNRSTKKSIKLLPAS